MADTAQVTLDTTDVDTHIGEAVGGGQLKEPIALIDIRRWVQAMNYPQPRHFDEETAARSPFGAIVAPQSFMVCCDVGHGAVPAVVGKIPDSHAVFGGDEFWFYGPCIQPGDLVRVKRRFDGYSIAETKFAGPTMFSRGDTTYVNQRKEAIGTQRSTMVRYLPELARTRGYYGQQAEIPTWTMAKLAEIEYQQLDWVRSGASGEGPDAVEVGQPLPLRPIGPHSAAQFVTEYRAFMFTVWGSHYMEGHYYGEDAGWIPELLGAEGDGSDPSMAIGLDRGPASGHTNVEKAKLVGLPRAYGYGSSISAWVLDYAAYWAGDRGFVRHAKVDYRSPTFEGDLALLRGVVRESRWEPVLGVNVATIAITMLNQDDVVLAKGFVDVELPPA